MRQHLALLLSDLEAAQAPHGTTLFQVTKIQPAGRFDRLLESKYFLCFLLRKTSNFNFFFASGQNQKFEDVSLGVFLDEDESLNQFMFRLQTGFRGPVRNPPPTKTIVDFGV